MIISIPHNRLIALQSVVMTFTILCFSFVRQGEEGCKGGGGGGGGRDGERVTVSLKNVQCRL